MTSILKVNPPKQALVQPKQRSFGFQVPVWYQDSFTFCYCHGCVLSLQTPTTSDSLTPLSSKSFLWSNVSCSFFLCSSKLPLIFLVFNKSFNTLHKSEGFQNLDRRIESESLPIIESNVIEIPNILGWSVLPYPIPWILWLLDPCKLNFYHEIPNILKGYNNILAPTKKRPNSFKSQRIDPSDWYT